MNRTSGAWTRSSPDPQTHPHTHSTTSSLISTPIEGTFRPPSEGNPMTVVSTHDFGFGPSEISIFYAYAADHNHAGWKLMQFTKVGGAPTWGKWAHKNVAPYPDLQMTTGTAAVVYMTSVAWVQNGRAAYSVWWNDVNGNVYRWRRDSTGKWNNDGLVPGVQIHSSHFKVTYTEGFGTIDIFTSSSTAEGRKRHWQSSPYTDAWIDLSYQEEMEGENAGWEWIVPLSEGALPWFFNHIFNCFFFFYILFSKFVNACTWESSPQRIMGVSWADPRLLATHIYGISGNSYMTVFMLNARNQITSVMWQSGQGWANPVIVASLSASRALSIQGIYAA
ncbi:hypothetical protein FRB96_003935 [Tulasnella sp. 330]|nr:hypothetical protein FRB96_003935 [Tulasnella sp. 330]KAG8872886.1 hypothetical protein FRB97_007267 [Tulasnella sp. 331]